MTAGAWSLPPPPGHRIMESFAPKLISASEYKSSSANARVQPYTSHISVTLLLSETKPALHTSDVAFGWITTGDGAEGAEWVNGDGGSCSSR